MLLLRACARGASVMRGAALGGTAGTWVSPAAAAATALPALRRALAPQPALAPRLLRRGVTPAEIAFAALDAAPLAGLDEDL